MKTIFVISSLLLSFFRKFYALPKNSEELKIKKVDEAESGYFAVEFQGQWHRVEPYDTPMGEAIRVNYLFRFVFGFEL